MSVIGFSAVAYPYGWLGNMSPFPVTYKGVAYRTTEALFQCLRFPGHPEVLEKIIEQKGPMGSKMVCKPHRDLLGPICDAADVARMEMCLRLKCDQHPELREKLIRTGSATIVEDCGKRADIEIDGKNHGGGAPFWGARLDLSTGNWKGRNIMGVLWMKLRQDFQSGLATIPPDPPSFAGSLFHKESTTAMSIIEKLASAEAEVQRLKTLAETYGKVEAVVREAGHKSLDEFLKEVGIAEKAVPPAAEKKEGKGKAGRPAKRKRVTITAELVAEMKSLRKIEKLSQEKTAKKLGVSLSSVVNWEKKKFVFAKKKGN